MKTFGTPILATVVIPHKLLVEFILVLPVGLDGDWQALQIEVPHTHELLQHIHAEPEFLFSMKDVRAMLQAFMPGTPITRARATALFPCFEQTKCAN